MESAPVPAETGAMIGAGGRPNIDARDTGPSADMWGWPGLH
jgi:hypothetical protein